MDTATVFDILGILFVFYLIALLLNDPMGCLTAIGVIAVIVMVILLII